MTQFISFIAIVLCIVIGLTQAQKTPVPSDQFAGSVVYGNPSARHRLHIAVDFTCGQCVNWYIQNGREIFEWAQNSTSPIFATMNLFPLPYHYASFDLAVASKLIRNKKQPADVQRFYGKVLSAKGAINNDKIAKLNREQIRDLIFDTFLADEGIYRDEWTNIWNNSEDTQAIRAEFKVNAQHSITGTPTFIANGVKVEDGDKLTVEDWKKFFSSL